MFTIADQLGRNIVLAQYPPKRIVSLVPSQTELLADLGLDEAVTGITKFCVHPQAWFNSMTRIGGTKNVAIEKIKALQPDLIIANKEENVQQQIEALEQIAPVWVSDVNNLEEALDMIKSVGILTDRETQATIIVHNIQQSFSGLLAAAQKTRTAYLIWRNPYMTVGNDTFIHDMLTRCGLHNVFKAEQRYPAITLEQLQQHNIQLVLLSSEPYPFKATHAAEIKAALPEATILMVDGEMFSWYGSRLLYAAQYFKELLNKIHTPEANGFNDFA